MAGCYAQAQRNQGTPGPKEPRQPRRELSLRPTATTAGLEPDFGTGWAERERRQWRPVDQALAVLWQACAWREELIQLLELLAERADRRFHPLPRPGPWRRSAGIWSGRPRRRGYHAVAWHKDGVGGLREHAGAASVLP